MPQSYHPVPLQAFGLIDDSVSPAPRVFSGDPTGDAEADVRQPIDGGPTTPEDEPYFVGFESSVGFASADVADLPQGETFMTGQTPVKLVGLAGDFFVVFHRGTRVMTPERLDITQPSLAQADYAMRRSGGGRGDHGAIISRNLLTYLQEEGANGQLAGGWADADTDNTPDGYTETNLNSTAWNSGVYEGFVDTGSGTGSLNVTVPFPVDGAEVTVSVQADQVHGDGDQAIRIEALDETESVITGGVSDVTYSSTGRTSATLTTPDGTHYLKVYPVRVTNVTANNTKFQIQDPCLRPGTADTYVPR